jgi:hypothetical protein
MLETFVSKLILYVYQNARWNQRKISLKIIQNILEKKHILLPNKVPWYCAFNLQPLFPIKSQDPNELEIFKFWTSSTTDPTLCFTFYPKQLL